MRIQVHAAGAAASPRVFSGAGAAQLNANCTGDRGGVRAAAGGCWGLLFVKRAKCHSPGVSNPREDTSKTKSYT